ncbi:MAG: glycosyltransferase family 2 protein [Gemmobacter sp.]
MPRATWMVHATVHEPVALVCAFVAHYLDLGADLIDLRLDRPAPEVERLLAPLDRVRVTVCTDAYWQATGRDARPALHTLRQRVNAAHAYRALEQDWMLFCDADEFLVPEGLFADRLAALPARVQFRRIRVVERVQRAGVPQEGLFDGVFRGPLADRGDVAERVYGRDAARFLTRGMLGHVAGKSILRRGTDLVPSLHFPVPPRLGPLDRALIVATPPWRARLDGAVIAHFDGLTPLHFLLKLLHKHVSALEAPDAPPSKRTEARRALIAAVAAGCLDDAALRQLQALLWLTPEAEALLRTENALHALHLDPAAAALRRFPGAGLDYAAAPFDASLRMQYAALIARTGFPL